MKKNNLRRLIINSMLSLGYLTLVSGCASSERALKNSPIGKEVNLDFDRKQTNLWPLYYSEGDNQSILWPMIDVDKKGFAVRPLFHRNSNDYGILWPYCSFNTRKKTGWALPVFWNNNFIAYGPMWHNWDWESYGFIPLMAVEPDNGYVLNYLWNDNTKSKTFLPLAHFSPENNYVLNYFWNNQDKSRAFVPFYAQNDEGGYVLNYFWNNQDKSRAFVPFYAQNDAGGYVLNYFWNNETKSKFIFPAAYLSPDFNCVLNTWWNKKLGTYGFFPLGGKTENLNYVLLGIWNQGYWMVLPVMGQGKDWFWAFNYYRNQDKHNILPFVYWDNEKTWVFNFYKDQEKTLILPFGGKGKDWFWAFNYLHNAGNNIIFPLCGWKNNKSIFDICTPLFSTSYKKNTRKFDFMNFAGPLAHYNHNSNDGIGLTLFYYATYNESPSEFGLSLLFGKTHHELPFLINYYENNSGQNGFSLLWNILFGYENTSGNGEFSVKDFTSDGIDSSFNDNVTHKSWALLGSYLGKQGSTKIWKNDADTELCDTLHSQLAEMLNLQKNLEYQQFTATKAAHSNAALERRAEIKRKIAKLQEDIKKQSAKIELDLPEINSSEMAESAFRNFLLATTIEADFSSHKLLFGLLWNHETLAQDYQWSILWRIVRGVKIDDQEMVKILGKAFSYQRDGERTRYSFFPGITIESAPGKHRWSILGDMFERHTENARSGGRILWIPYGN